MEGGHCALRRGGVGLGYTFEAVVDVVAGGWCGVEGRLIHPHSTPSTYMKVAIVNLYTHYY